VYSFIAPEYKDKSHSVDLDGAKKELSDGGLSSSRATY